MKTCKHEGCTKEVNAIGLCFTHYMQARRAGLTNVGNRARGTTEERFWRFVDKKTDAECWNWTGNLVAGYGRISIGAKKDGATGSHRFSWELHNKQSIPSGMVVMHSCDNPLCVNPNHLSVGTYKDNTQDMIAKGRKVVVAPVGDKNGKSILTEDIVRAIRASSLAHAELGRQFNVSPNCIRGVRIGRTWSHVK
jgi:hypothetical protein